jgi:hypothetical protein
LRRTHAVLLAADGDHVAGLQSVPASRVDLAVHAHLALLHQQLRVAAGGRRPGELEKGTQRQRAGDDDVVQLLRRIGMMR